MPKAMQYTKGSIIYFAGDKDERLFVLQKGLILLTSTNIETNEPLTEHIHEGEFFGVKSALGHFPREETATVIADSHALTFTVPEFEQIFSGNKQVIIKMLRVFSKQLRSIHRKTESILNNDTDIDQTSGMLSVAKSFFEAGQYQACCDVCTKLLSRFKNTSKKATAEKLYADTKRRLDMQKKTEGKAALRESPSRTDDAFKQFSLPAFSRFAKTFEAGSVIISEYEPGDCFYLIQSGQVQLVKCVNGSKKNIDILLPSEFFGEMAILENTPRSATAVAINEVTVLEFNKENFEILIMGNPQIAVILLKLFCKRIYDQKRRFKILIIEDLSAKIADVFLMFDEMNPVEDETDKTRRFNLTIQDLSHWAGIPLETTQDEVKKFASSRKIEIYDTYMVINNIIDMRRFVDTKITQRST